MPVRHLASIVALSSLAAGANACSSSSGSGGPHSTGCTSDCSDAAASEAGVSEGGGGTDAAQESGGNDGGTSQQYVGGVSLDKRGTLYSLAAVFYPAPDAGASSACAGMQMGACCYRPANGSVPSYTYASAGTLTIQDQGLSISTITPSPMNIYSDTSANGGSLSWKPGDMLSASASGDTVSAFTTQIEATDDVGTTTPSLSQAVTISTQSDWTLSWTAATQSGASMDLRISDSKTYGSIDCVVKDSAATVVVSKSLLANFTVGDTGTVSLTRLQEATFTSGNVQGTITVSTLGPAPAVTFK